MRYYIIAGEASGDLHGSNLVKEIHKLDGQADIRCWGGDKMQQAGATLVKHYRELAFMGFIEVLANLSTILQNLRFCKADISAFNPDVIILIDYPGFNLRIAKWAKASGHRVVYYISPQVWAWKESRVKLIRKTVDRMLVILPFEKEFYAKWRYDVEYVGHPLVHVVEDALRNDFTLPQEIASPLNAKNVVAILPGSRKQEVAMKLPIMLKVTRHFPDHHFIIAKAPSLEDEFYRPFLEQFNQVRAIRNRTYELLMKSKGAMVTSGTATLETALFGVPQVVCYKGSNLSYQIARRLVRVKYISLVNLIMDRPIVKELIQDEMTEENLTKELHKVLKDAGEISKMKSDYMQLRQLLGGHGNASATAARTIVDFVRSALKNSKS